MPNFNKKSKLTITHLKYKIPQLLILFRLLLAPIILCCVYYFKENSKIIVLLLMYLGLLSDIFDGIIARELNVANEQLRRWDSQTDMLFWVSIGISTWLLYPDLIRANHTTILILFIMEAMCYIISIVRFKKETCTHAFLSKIWGICLLIAFTSLIGFNHAGIPFAIAIVMGLISHIDRILITLILPHWAHDVPSFYHAYLMRKDIGFKKYKLFN